MGLQTATSEDLTFCWSGLLEPFFPVTNIPIKFLIPYPVFPQKILQAGKLSVTSFERALSISYWHSGCPYKAALRGCSGLEMTLWFLSVFETAGERPQ